MSSPTEISTLARQLGAPADSIALALYNCGVADLSPALLSELADHLRAGVGGDPVIRAIASKARARAEVVAYRHHQTIAAEAKATGRLRVSLHERTRQAVAEWREGR